MSRILLGVTVSVLIACNSTPIDRTTVSQSTPAAAKLDTLLHVLLGKGAKAGKHALPKKLVTLKSKVVNGQQDVVVDVLMQAAPSAVPQLKQLGVDVRTVTPSGIITASVALSQLMAVAALADVERIEAAKAKRLYNDRSNALAQTTSADGAVYYGMNNGRSKTGAGVVVGVIDSGCDWTHGDLIVDGTEASAEPRTRIRYYWDQTDTTVDRTPTGFTYGYEYTDANLNDALKASVGQVNDPTLPSWFALDAAYPIRASARDTNGHGTHVAGTAAGDGSASGYKGVAPAADLICVKFDFDNVAGRNTDANIIDAVSYVFARAATLGKPAVINMSLGSDHGPHDGSTLEERGIDDLTGPGKIVVVAAGNPGSNNWSSKRTWGFPLHNSGALNGEATTFRFPVRQAATEDYAFLDIWYKGGNKCKVLVTSPGGLTFPPAGASPRTWTTGSAYVGFNSAEGSVFVGNGGDQLGWGDTNADHEVYVEISNTNGTAPAVGEWTIRFVPADSRSTCAGTYHLWHGESDNVIAGWKAELSLPNPGAPTPRVGGRDPNNAYTIGSPASANRVIAVAAYQTRNSWPYVYGTTCTATPDFTQSYDAAPIGYYDPYALGELAYFSARGPRRDNVLKPEIATPGVGIISAMSHFVLNAEWPARCTPWGTAGAKYHFGMNRVPNLEATVMQGTSMATPNATGAIALLLQAKGNITDACLRTAFAASARRDAATDNARSVSDSALTDTDTSAAPGRLSNFDWGYGKFDVDAALGVIGSSCPTCKAAGQSCTAASDCCSNVCSGKRIKVCK